MTLYEFHRILGETIMFCQTIEHDVKLIFSMMSKGDIDANFEEIKRLSMGEVVTLLEKLDATDNNMYFTKEDYKFLKQITKTRNYWCHQAYTDFVYIKNFQNSPAFQKIFDRLKRENNALRNISSNVEQVRLKVLKDFR